MSLILHSRTIFQMEIQYSDLGVSFRNRYLMMISNPYRLSAYRKIIEFYYIIVWSLSSHPVHSWFVSRKAIVNMNRSYIVTHDSNALRKRHTSKIFTYRLNIWWFCFSSYWLENESSHFYQIDCTLTSTNVKKNRYPTCL